MRPGAVLALALLPLVTASPGLLSELRAASSASASCPLQLVCAALQTREPGLASLRAAPFMAGLLALAGDTAGNSSEAAADTADSAFLHQLRAAADTGRAGGECAALAPDCGLEDGALLQAAVELLRGGRVQLRAQSRPRRSVAGLPPLITIAGDNNDCGTCETINSICVVFGIGSFKACLVSILGGPVAVGVCNAVATPGRIGCVINTALCFLKGCGAVRLPRITRRP